MEFFNRKQEVMDVQMTQYGKYLLSKGRFKPEFYAFYDDDITYDWDNASTGTSAGENQNDIEDRIKETPRMKTQYVFSGIETNIKEINEMVLVKQQAKLGGEKIQPTAEKNYSLAYPLGNSTPENEFLPAWNIEYLGANLLTASQNLDIYGNKLDGSGNPVIARTLPIPQLTSDFIYENDIAVVYEEDIPYVQVLDEDTDIFILEIGETNTVFRKDNFDIEVFRIEDNFDLDGNKTGEETLIPLSFSTKQQAVYDIESEIELGGEGEDIFEIDEFDSTYVEHYFHVLVDGEIDTDTLCLVKPADKSQGIFSDRVEACSPTSGKVPLNIYDDLIEDPGEPC